LAEPLREGNEARCLRRGEAQDQGAEVAVGVRVLVLPQLFATDKIRTVRELKGKPVAAGPTGGSGPTFLASMASHVGLNPLRMREIPYNHWRDYDP